MDAGRRWGRGAGVVVGHPDTGYTRHYEIWSANAAANRLRIDKGYDFLKADADAEDELRKSRWYSPRWPGHGTGTASVIMGADGPPPPGKRSMTGAAPRASLVPLRVSESVILLDYDNLAMALRRGGDAGHHVVSISMGGPSPIDYLERALDHAIERGVIVLAAAGNVWPFVVWPAHYDQVIAVAASNCRDRAWSKSATGGAVNISAPGESVWRASAGEDRGAADDDVGRSSGTSYAVATAAGACALWLAHHGRDALIAKYGHPRHLAPVFKEVLTTQGVDTPAGWDVRSLGSGILNAEKLLKARLPATPPAGGFRRLRATGPASPTGLEDIVGLFPGVSPNTVRRGVERLLNTSGAELGGVLADHRSELRLRLGVDPALREQVVDLGRGRKRAQAGPAGGRPRAWRTASTGLARQIDGTT